MKKAKLYIIGEIFCISEKDGKVTITLIVKKDRIVRVTLPRRCCCPKNWNASDYVKITGSVTSIDDGEESCEAYKIEFSNAVLQKIFTAKSQNDKPDFCGDFHLVGTIERITPIGEDNYILTFSADDAIYTIYIDRYILFHNIIKLDISKKMRIEGKVSIISYHRYNFEGAISQINYIATNLDYI